MDEKQAAITAVLIDAAVAIGTDHDDETDPVGLALESLNGLGAVQVIVDDELRPESVEIAPIVMSAVAAIYRLSAWTAAARGCEIEEVFADLRAASVAT
jgi:hypothetical protein